ncbi:MAG: serine hydrolase [Pyrinomonadaceae bacterium]|nr:serine hydrolase [Pyrinomonadaceae bacterium]
MNKTILKLSVFALFLCFTNSVCFGQMTTEQIDALVKNSMAKFKVAGFSVGVVKDGKIIYAKGFGVKSINSKASVDEHTNFAIASNSKAFTTVALAILVEEGKLKWTDKVKTYVPEFKMYDSYVTENFIIEDLLTHRSGLGMGAGDLMFFPDGTDFTINDLLPVFQHFKPVSQFRTKWDYDNLLYIVAGEIIKRVTGMTWEDFVTKRILEPLKMNDSATAYDKLKSKNNLASAHSSDKGKLEILPDNKEMINGAAGGIYSNAEDMCKWMLAHLNKGKYGEGLKDTLFSVPTQRKLWKIHTVQDADPDPRYNSHFAGYGLGFRLTDKKGNMVVDHTGGLPGMASKVTMIPDLNLGIVVLTNTTLEGAGIYSAVTNTIVDSYLGLNDNDWIGKLTAFFENRNKTGDTVTNQVWEAVKTADKSKINENDYIGIYQDAWFGKMEVFKKGDQLWIKSYRSPKLNGPMMFYKANTFAIKWEFQDMNCDAFAMFSLDENGKANGFKMKGISPNIDFSFDFQDLDLKRVEKK